MQMIKTEMSTADLLMDRLVRAYVKKYRLMFAADHVSAT